MRTPRLSSTEFPQPKSAALSIKIKPAVKKKNRRLFTVRLLFMFVVILSSLSFSPSMRAVLFAAAKTQYGRLCTDDRFRKADKKSPEILGFQDFQSCGSRTRTCDLRVMSPTSCQLLYPAMFILVIQLSLKCILDGAGDRGRTGTIGKDRGILSPVRLPIPPPRQNWLQGWGSNPQPIG